MARRDGDFTEKAKQTLRDRVGGRCSSPQCTRQTTGPHDDSSKSVTIGEAAHIRSNSKNGPRYEAGFEKIGETENGIWLCRNCHKLIDHEPGRYPTEMLLEWKESAEQKARSEIESTANENNNKCLSNEAWDFLRVLNISPEQYVIENWDFEERTLQVGKHAYRTASRRDVRKEQAIEELVLELLRSELLEVRSEGRASRELRPTSRCFRILDSLK